MRGSFGAPTAQPCTSSSSSRRVKPLEAVTAVAVIPWSIASLTGFALWTAMYAPLIAADKLHELITGRRP
jgi:hypothetical protein